VPQNVQTQGSHEIYLSLFRAGGQSQEWISSLRKSEPPRRLSIGSPLPQYLCHLQLACQLASPRRRQPKSRKPLPGWLLPWYHCMVPLGWLPMVAPQTFHSQCRSRAVWTDHRPGSSSYLPGSRWQRRKPRKFPTTWLVFWWALGMSGSIQDSCGHTELKPSDWCPRGSVASLLVFPRWPIAPNHKCRISVRLKSTSGSRNWPAWEPSNRRTNWEYAEWQILLRLFGEWSAWPDRNAGRSVPRWRSFPLCWTLFRLAESIPSWLCVPLFSLSGWPLWCLVILSVEWSHWHISGWIFYSGSWIRGATQHI